MGSEGEVNKIIFFLTSSIISKHQLLQWRSPAFLFKVRLFVVYKGLSVCSERIMKEKKLNFMHQNAQIQKTENIHHDSSFLLKVLFSSCSVIF